MGKNNELNPFISIIIPLYVIEERFFDDLTHYNNLDYGNYELIIVCDKEVKISPKIKNVKLIITGQQGTGPAEKRDLALKHAKGDICAFIDDDAYPDSSWLSNASKSFGDKDVVAVGGPGLTPPDDEFWQKVGGNIIESYLCSGGIQYRFYKMTKKFYVRDYPAYNLLVRTDVLKKVGGYGSTFYGGEDTLLCLKLIKYGKILYDPDVVVYHHRRKFPLELSRQIGGVGLHRGFFFKKYPETSRRIFYTLPSLLTLSLVGCLIMTIVYPYLFLVPFTVSFVFIWGIATLSVFSHKVNFFQAVVAGVGIIAMHIVYGVNFIKGLCTSNLTR